jgi:hypothetical protein
MSGSTELFPLHSQLPNMTPHQHLKALTDKLIDTTAIVASCTPKGKRLLKSLGKKIEDLLHPIPAQDEQRVANEMQLHIQEDKKG